MVAPKPERYERYFSNKQWDRCMQQFLAQIKTPTTRRSYAYMLRRLFSDPKKTPDKFTRADIETYINAPTWGILPGKPPAPTTHNNRYMAVRSFYTWCTRYNVEYRGKLRPILRGSKPTDGVRLLKSPESERDMEEAEVFAFLSVIDRSKLIGKRDFALFFALLILGRRKTEVSTLRWGDIEQVTFSEGGTGWRYAFKAKGRVDREHAEIPAEVMSFIEEYLRAADRWEHMEADDPIFVGWPNRHWCKHPIGASVICRRFRFYANLAGLSPTYCPHSLRYENAWQRFITNGNDLIRVQEELGWRDINTALHYIRRRQRRKQGDPTARALASKFGRM